MRIVFLTAGAAGMYCGSCMHDNALAKALRRADVDCLLQPLYTPLRTDEVSIASERVFFGGVNIYLLEKLPLFRRMPVAIKRMLDRPRFLRWATRGATSTDAASLGKLTLSMLRGENGNQRDEVTRLVGWLRDEMRPDAIVLTNLLIGGPIPAIRRELPDTKLIAILQGDDAFLDYLREPFRDEAIALMGDLGRACDRIIVNSRFYAEKMIALLRLDPARVEVLPLTIDTEPFQNEPLRAVVDDQLGDAARPPRIGYFARIAPEKGLHNLVAAFIDLASRPGCETVGLDIAGWLGAQHRGYLAVQLKRLSDAGVGDRVRHLGSPDLAGKLAMLRGIDLLSVPTEHEEPKGLTILEAMAMGVPVVLPAKGAFTEIVEASGGGVLVPPDRPELLADSLQRLLIDHEERRRLGAVARDWVLRERAIDVQAAGMIDLLGRLAAPLPAVG